MLSGSSALLTIGLGFERRHLSTWPRRPGRPRRLVVIANEMSMPSSSFNLSNPSLPDRALAERRIAVLFVTNLSDDLMPPRGAAVSVRRKRKPSEFHSEVTRERIRAAVIIDRFQKHFMGEL